MFLQERTRWNLAYPIHYKWALASSIIPYLYDIVNASQHSYPLHRELYRLNAFLLNNRMG